MKPGKFITIDGVEGAGKTTQGNALHLMQHKKPAQLQTIGILQKPSNIKKGFALFKKALKRSAVKAGTVTK
ncbi:hypothetical protein [Candidatus Thioglobus sp.]|uniref:hypothetical protein n=1 Tax=Candidatus Thioglobus sp. TaxID=2026721 RepID=UPI003D0CEEB2